MRESIKHLSDEALNDILIGMESPESEAHLASCTLCRGQVEEFRSDMNEFSQTTLAWNQARSNRMEQINVRPRLQWLSYSHMRWALAAIVLLAIAMPVWRHNDHFRSNENTAQVSSSEDSDAHAQIAEDNELLKAVTVAINQDDESLSNEYQLLEGPNPRLKTRPE